MASIRQLSKATAELHSVRTEKNENLKVISSMSEEEAKRFTAAEKKSETHLQECQDFKFRIGTILESESFADFTIEVEGRSIKAHKCILASRYVWT